VNKSELIYSGDDSGYHRDGKPTRNVFAEEGNNTGHAKYSLETGELVALLVRQTLLEALFRGMECRSGVTDSWKPEVSVFQSAHTCARHANQKLSGIKPPTIGVKAKCSRFISARFFSL